MDGVSICPQTSHQDNRSLLPRQGTMLRFRAEEPDWIIILPISCQWEQMVALHALRADPVRLILKSVRFIVSPFRVLLIRQTNGRRSPKSSNALINKKCIHR